MPGITEWHRDEWTISTDRARLQIDEIHRFLREESYWAQNRTREQLEIAIQNSLSFGLYRGETQVGFARVTSDFATFAYLGDVFILEAFRGQGLSQWLLQTILDYPDLQGLRRWILATRDAHTLYAKFGFESLKHPDRWMEKPAPDAY